MKIVRYIGDDCDSINGFNNGGYIDGNPITVKDDTRALRLCKKALHQRWDFKDSELEHYNTDPDGYQLIIGYYDENGNELTPEEYDERDNPNDSYRYVYCSYEVVEE